MDQAFKDHLEKLLLKDTRLVDDQGELKGNVVKKFANELDETIIGYLLEDEKTRNHFFLKVKDVYVFKTNDFIFFLEQNKLDNSFTKYANTIGLTLNGKFLKDNTDIVLDFPYKDCILEGGQSTEEGLDAYYEFDTELSADDKKKGYEPNQYNEKQAKRKEIFFNNIIAKDEIDRLLEPKAFTNILEYSKEGTKKPSQFSRNKEGGITDNLIVKGNNLLALHSLKKEFKSKVKLIYIDPPYNTGSDSFAYNDNFNHSSWLTFIYNRLSVARDLLSDDGCIFVHIDHHQVGYLNILLNDVFNLRNKVQIIAVKTASPAGFKTVNPGPIDVTEYILFYTKEKSNFNFKKGFVPVGYNKNYNLFVEKSNDIKKWKFIPIREKVIQDMGFKTEKEAKDKYGNLWSRLYPILLEDFTYKNADSVVSVRDPHKPTETVKKLMKESKNSPHPIEYKREDGSFMYLYNGGALAFYSNKMQTIDGKPTITELLTDFWDHISWAGIGKEGGVKLKNGKKPEKLLKEIIELTTSEGDIVMDYHLGSGTTAAVAHKLKRQYIGIEQLDYDDNDSVVRLQNVINGDTTGASKSVNWIAGGSFIYLELAKNNEKAKELIEQCKSFDALVKLFDTLYSKYFLHYNIRLKDFKETIIKEDQFKALSLNKQKEMFCRMLDNNQLYVNRDEMEDKQFGIAKEDIALTKDFYQIKD
jgi:adenine-specific DNA-methyltransferase